MLAAAAAAGQQVVEVQVGRVAPASAARVGLLTAPAVQVVPMPPPPIGAAAAAAGLPFSVAAVQPAAKAVTVSS